MKLQNYAKAEIDLNRALTSYMSAKKEEQKDSKAGQYKVLYNLGINYRSQGKLNESVEAFARAIGINGGGRPAAYNNMGLSNFQNHKYKEAIADFSQAIKASGGLVKSAFFDVKVRLLGDEEQVTVRSLTEDAKAIIVINISQPPDPQTQTAAQR